MTQKLKSTTNELWKGWKLSWCHHFTHIAYARKLRGLRQKLDALRVKKDNLFQSIRISSGNSSVTKGFHFLKLIWTPDFLCVQNAPFKATSSFFNPFWLHLLFFMHLLIILSYKTLKLKSISNELWKGWKLAWYHHFIHIAYSRKLRGLRQKLDALRVQNGQSLSKYQGFRQKLIRYKGISFFK